MQIIESNNQLREQLDVWRGENETIGFVPTMGNLHQGHLKLVKCSKQHASKTVVSIFVNPLQFPPGTDFENYPRTSEKDIESLKSLGVDVVYCPEVSSIYPKGIDGSVKVIVPELSKILCGEFRLGHFEGVTTVVATLFNIVQPTVAVFGEKDYQQLVIIRRMVEDLKFPIKIIGVETERDANGLALSSRNQYLSDEEKQIAGQLNWTLHFVAQQVQKRCKRESPSLCDFHDIEQEAMQKLKGFGFRPEYVQVRDADDLSAGHIQCGNLRVFAAAWLGKARLIDNLSIN